MDERELVRRAQRGDPRAFERLVEQHAPRLYTLAARSLGSDADGADAVQEALIRAWQALPRFRGDAQLTTWLYRITLNAIHDQRTRRRVTEELPEAAADPVDRVEQSELSAELRKALAGLEDDYRTAVLMYDVLGHSYAEIAEATNVPEGTVKSRIFRGRRELARRLEGLRVDG